MNIFHTKYFIQNTAQRGFSLLELLIYMAILSVLMVIISDAFISLSKGRGQSEAKNEVNSAIRFAIERIRQDLKSATSTAPITIPFFGTSSSTLRMITASSSVITYGVTSGQLMRTYDTNTAPTTGSNVTVSAPIFTRIENYNSVFNATTTSIQIDMMFSYNSSSTDWMYSDRLRTSVTLR